MELIYPKTVSIKLEEEERDSLERTTILLERMFDEVECEECPFKERCDKVSERECLLCTLARDLKYINNNCD